MKSVLISAGIIFLSLVLHGQTIAYEIDPAANSEISISGGSTLHDWVVQTTGPSKHPESLVIGEDGSLLVESFGFEVDVKSMEGGRGSSMNSKIYKALLADQYPVVVFNQTSFSQNEKEPFALVSTGLLSIAGVEREIEVEITGRLEGNTLILEGHEPLLMSDYGIDPPSAMFGQIQTKDDIVVSFKFQYIKQ